MRNWHLYHDQRTKSASSLLRTIGNRAIRPIATGYDPDYLMGLKGTLTGPGLSIVIAEDQIDRILPKRVAVEPLEPGKVGRRRVA